MKLKEVFDQLSYAEFSQISVDGGPAGVIEPSAYPKMLAHINLALTALYSRFKLKEGRFNIRLMSNINSYPLTIQNALNGKSACLSPKYIEDNLSMPFKDDILKIEKVISVGGYEFPLNKDNDPWSIHTPNMKTIVVPSKLLDTTLDIPEKWKGNLLSVIYRANHPRLAVKLGLFDPERIELELPNSHLMALLYFIASRAHNPVGMVNEFNMGNNFYAKYEQECALLEGANLEVDQGHTNDRLRKNGWV